jgi:hypothetical protein
MQGISQHWSCFRYGRGEHHPGASRHAEKNGIDRLPSAEVPQVDHRVSQGFQSVVQFTDAFEAQQQALEFVFPGEHPLDGVETLLENGGVE